jgi:uncharacterized protein (DUF2236 family)
MPNRHAAGRVEELSPVPLPQALTHRLDAWASRLLQPPEGPHFDFTRPAGEPALVAADSIAWQVFRNPLSLLIGGMTAVILELAEPAVRSGVWEHSSFRTQPVRRLQRTGLAAMATVYGARSQAEAMIAAVVRRHDRVSGETPAGVAYRANEPALLNWVQATAGFGFAEAYHRYLRPLRRDELDRFYAEGVPAARLYGALDAPRCEAERQALFATMRGRLEPSPIVFEFLELMRRAPILPSALRPFQALLVRAAVEAVPDWVRLRLGLAPDLGLRPWQRTLVRQACAVADRLLLPSAPPVQACLRLGLPADYLFRR